MGKWTWTNDNNKHKHHNSNSVNFSMMIKFKDVVEFAITSHTCIIYSIIQLFISQVWWFSPLHHRWTIEYQYSCQYSYEYLSACRRVRVLLLWNSRVRVQYEYQKFSTRVLWVRVPSTSTPALSMSTYFLPASLRLWYCFQVVCPSVFLYHVYQPFRLVGQMWVQNCRVS